MHRVWRAIASLSIVVFVAVACAAPEAQPTVAPTSAPQIANPASENCAKQGGELSIDKNGAGAEFGVCLFDDNQQCEEWALMRGECPAGGIKITGYVTLAARYCAITGGEYAVTGDSGVETEQGTCTFKNGKSCDVWDYFNGKCSVNE